ncbi:unnamed protein product [Dibothriocephalus latus]|uniref:Uncharacterized protein n=1 Tax=Dibothriocephalus latus TaxID=60516 RepID=A0A3P7QUH0_DIBLA|nr:unnamed protein product [Dibothriocephalus latus]
MSSVYSAAGPPMTAYLNPIPTTPGLQTPLEAPACSTSAATLSPSVYNSDGYTLKPIPCPATAPTTTANGSFSSSSPVSRKSHNPDAHKHSNGPSSSSTTSDDGLYELSEEDVKEIDDMVGYYYLCKNNFNASSSM